MSARKPDLRWEILPIFEVVVGFSMGFIFYGQRLTGLNRTGTDHYGEEGWGDMGAWIRWGIPLAALGAYLLLSLGMWAAARARDPLGDVNALRRLSGLPPVGDEALKESVRARLVRAQYLCKVVVGAAALGAQFVFCQHLIGKLNLGGF